MTPQEFQQKERELLHKVQTAIKIRYEHEVGVSLNDRLKHIRVGVDSALAQNGGLVGLLFDKGVFTPEEYYAFQIKALENEVEMQTERVAGLLGVSPDKVNLI